MKQSYKLKFQTMNTGAKLGITPPGTPLELRRVNSLPHGSNSGIWKGEWFQIMKCIWLPSWPQVCYQQNKISPYNLLGLTRNQWLGRGDILGTSPSSLEQSCVYTPNSTGRISWECMSTVPWHELRAPVRQLHSSAPSRKIVDLRSKGKPYRCSCRNYFSPRIELVTTNLLGKEDTMITKLFFQDERTSIV